ncbi:MAG TPA: sorbosone dehydrogenase family protein [candidate division Zixibacteria bacterium]|nr:sorbosone dehydrogenase family protein [candidate division Zixibacteria bacterium]
MLASCSEAGPAARATAPDGDLGKISLPPGFSISYYADRMPGARSMRLGDNGTLFVGTRGDKVYALRDVDGDYRADSLYVIATGLDMPNGVAFRDGSLYVAEVSRVIRLDGIESRLSDPPTPAVVTDTFPSDRAHGWKFIGFGPDGRLYVPVGFPCNVCEPDEDICGTIVRMDPDGGRAETFARGVRNTVGFDWEPTSGVLWFTDNGRDRMGDDIPPDELNRAPSAGMHFGFPYCHAGDIPDPQFGQGADCDTFAAPVRKLGPHAAALGMRFYTGAMFPEKYRGQIFIAEHGSWNRSTPLGYRVMLVTHDGEGHATSYEVFAEGWLEDNGARWGRPVDVLVMPDGSLLVSDDEAGAVYRITYGR